eukprot:TRINITY_DN8634_c2_g1_i3.p1 TRINITY_DN8634_c2_g1~~TRINITY_DN8634_c2_g1_i3.p1  ORF type:complete len:480 (+),score=119.10 TRINITY_DN8634_c2_g1_i3:342-1781(+)
MQQPLLPQGVDPDSFRRATHALQRCAFMLRRKVGHEKEDPQFDGLVRHKMLHITLFSMAGLVTMIVMDVLPWYRGIKTGNIYEQSDETLKTELLSLQLVLSLTTMVVLCLITQYYHLLLTKKRIEWSGVDITPKPTYNETEAERVKRENDKYDHIHSYSIWASKMFKYRLIAELVIHAVHPVIFLSNWGSFLEACKVVMLLRLYVFFDLLHLYSGPFRNRFEIVNQSDEYKETSFKISQSLTFKSLLNTHTALAVTVWAALTCIIGGFGMFLVERDADSQEPWVAGDIGWAGSMENSLYFAFVAASTIGYGEYYPATLKGRLMTAAIGIIGLGVVTVFQALLTNQLKPTKHEKYIREYLAAGETRNQYEEKAAVLIQRMWRFRRATRQGIEVPVFHKSNVIFGAMKKFRNIKYKFKHSENFTGSNDVVLEDKLDDLMSLANDVGVGVQDQRDQLLLLHKKVHKNLKNIRAKIYERTGRK